MIVLTEQFQEKIFICYCIARNLHRTLDLPHIARILKLRHLVNHKFISPPPCFVSTIITRLPITQKKGKFIDGQ